MIIRQELPTQKELKKLFRYDRKGFFVRKVKTGYATKIGQTVGAKKRTDGYCQMRVNTYKFLTHRLVFLFHKGYCPDHIDHINGKPWDNRIENLRETTHEKNLLNQKTHTNNKSGVRGVSFCNTHKVWKCRIKYEKIKKFSFTSKSKKECCKVCKEKQIEIWGEYVRD